MKPIKIYICSALTKASSALLQKVEKLKEAIKIHRSNWQVLEYYGLGPSPSDGKIFQFDTGQVKLATLVYVICDEDTWGGGAEYGISFMIGQHVLFHAATDWKKTRMITGPCELHPDQFMIDYYYTDNQFTFEGQAIAAIDRAITKFNLESSPEDLRQKMIERFLARGREFFGVDFQVVERNPIFGREAPVYSGSFEKLPPLEKESGLGPKQVPERVAGYGYEDIGGSPVQEGYEKTRTSGWKS